MPINNVSGASLSQPHSFGGRTGLVLMGASCARGFVVGMGGCGVAVDGTPWREIWGIGFRRSETIAPERQKSCGQAAATSDESTERGSHAGKAAAGLPHSKRRKSAPTGRVYAATATQRTRRSSGAKPPLQVARERTKRRYGTGLPSGSILWTSPMFSSRMPGSTLLMSPTMIQTRWLG
jgi:hypothetical protein